MKAVAAGCSLVVCVGAACGQAELPPPFWLRPSGHDCGNKMPVILKVGSFERWRPEQLAKVTFLAVHANDDALYLVDLGEAGRGYISRRHVPSDWRAATERGLLDACVTYLAPEEFTAELDRLREASAQRMAQPRSTLSIGMTKDQVLGSERGRPIKINTTTTKAGEREQWVYPGGVYVYFEGGRVVAIQN